jgi:hypothetical protein
MKKLISILTILIISNISHGANMAPVSEVEKKILDCEYPLTSSGSCQGSCIEIKKEFNCKYSELADEEIDDYSKPTWATRSMVEVCSGQADCEQKVSDKVCVDERHALTDAEFTETWCNKITGYEQVLSGNKIIVENATKKAAYETAKAASDAMEAAIEQAYKAINHGKRVIALLVVRNASKGLTTAQIEQMNLTYSEIKNLLETGSLVTAKEKIELITPDGTIVTESDKTALVSEINKFLGL